MIVLVHRPVIAMFVQVVVIVGVPETPKSTLPSLGDCDQYGHKAEVMKVFLGKHRLGNSDALVPGAGQDTMGLKLFAQFSKPTLDRAGSVGKLGKLREECGVCVRIHVATIAYEDLIWENQTV